MPQSIEQIASRTGIKETSGSFDFAEDQRQGRLLEDNRKFTAGGKGAAVPDPNTASLGAERNVRRAVEAGLAPDPLKLNQSIFASEASPSDVRDGTMTAYFEKSTNSYNIGPGLNLDSPLVEKALSKRGISSVELKDIYDFQGKQRIDTELVPVMKDVFNDVVEGAKKDARTFVGADVWNKLKPHERDALSDMSYNLGLKRLGGFKKMKEAIKMMVNKRSPEAISAVLEQMQDSRWFNQVGNRAIKIMNIFSNGEDSDTRRWNEFSGQSKA